MNFSKVGNIAFSTAMIAVTVYYSVSTYGALNKPEVAAVTQASEVEHTKVEMCLAAGQLFEDLMAARHEPRMDMEAFIQSRLAQKDMPENVEAIYDLALRNLKSDDEVTSYLVVEVVAECLRAN